MEVVTTAPVSWKGSAYSKTGDTSRRYVGSVKTNSSASVYKFTHNLESNMIVYQNAALNASPFRCLTTGTATTATSVSLSGVVPVTSTFVNLRLVNTADQTVYTNSDNSVSTTSFQMVLVAGNVVQTTLLNVHPTDSSQNVYYYFPLATGSGGANLDVYGYFYDR